MTDIKGARRLFDNSRSEHFAFGSFNADNQETIRAIAQAAKAKQSPALVEVSHGEVEAIGLANLRDLIDNYKAELGVELYLHLDHSPSVEAAKAGIDAGFESIHIDVSQAKKDAPIEEIIADDKIVVEYAKKTGAIVESEPHYFGGGSNVFKTDIDYDEIRKFFTKPAEAKSFVADTGIDTYAVAIGNLHGLYPVPKQLDINLLRQIRSTIDCYLSLHGGSGTPPEQFKAAAAAGISKININSELRKAFRTTLEEQLKSNPDEFAVVKLMPPVISAVQVIVEGKMDIFGSSGKAKTA